MDQLTGLKVFIQVADRHGFAPAARHMNMSTSMVSAHVQALEDRLGVRLLNRTTRKVSLTDVGRAYYERCAAILDDLNDADNIASALQANPRGRLRLYTSHSLVPFLAPVVADYMARYEAVTVDLSLGERLPDMIEEGYDLAIRTIPPPDSSLTVRNLARWRHVLTASPDYLARHGTPQTPEDLRHHNCLQYAFYPFGNEWHFTDARDQLVAIKVSGNLTTHSGETLRTVSVMGGGLFLAPSFLVHGDVKAGRLVRILTDYRPVEFAINALFPHRQHLPAKVRTFLDLLAERFAAGPDWLNW